MSPQFPGCRIFLFGDYSSKYHYIFLSCRSSHSLTARRHTHEISLYRCPAAAPRHGPAGYTRRGPAGCPTVAVSAGHSAPVPRSAHRGPRWEGAGRGLGRCLANISHDHNYYMIIPHDYNHRMIISHDYNYRMIISHDYNYRMIISHDYNYPG